MVHTSKHLRCEDCESREKGIFCDLDRLPLNEVSQHKVSNTYKKGQVVFHQGNPPYGLYCVSQGKIKISKHGPDGKESIVRIADPGDILGHRSLFSNENYTATATAMEETIVCFMDKKFILEAIQQQPSLSLNIIQKLSKEMGSAEQKNASLYQKSVRERLAELLLSLKASYGVPEKNRVRLNITLTREEFASMIGTASETVIRFISEFKESGIIEQEGKTIFILDEARLLELANLSY